MHVRALCCSSDKMLLNKQNAVVVMESTRHNNNTSYLLHLPDQFQRESISIDADRVEVPFAKINFIQQKCSARREDSRLLKGSCGKNTS